MKDCDFKKVSGSCHQKMFILKFTKYNFIKFYSSHLRLINDELVLDEVLKISDVKEASADSNFETGEDSEITPPEQFQNSFHQGGI